MEVAALLCHSQIALCHSQMFTDALLPLVAHPSSSSSWPSTIRSTTLTTSVVKHGCGVDGLQTQEMVGSGNEGEEEDERKESPRNW